jgi:hypothetical protein
MDARKWRGTSQTRSVAPGGYLLVTVSGFLELHRPFSAVQNTTLVGEQAPQLSVEL